MKFFGKIGFVQSKETTPGVWQDEPIEAEYAGDILRNTRRWEGASQLNDNLQLNNQISILADDFLSKSYFEIRYIKWRGGVWKVTNVEVQFPRMLLTIGGVYNGETA